MFNLVRHWERMRLEKRDGFRSAKIILTRSKSFTKSDDSILRSTQNMIKSIISHSHHLASSSNNTNSNSRSKSQALHASSNFDSSFNPSLIKSDNNINNITTMTTTTTTTSTSTTANSSNHKSLAVQQKRTKSSLNRLVRQKSFDENDQFKLEPILQPVNNEVYSYIAKNDPTIAAIIAAAVESDKNAKKQEQEQENVALTTEIEKINESIKEMSFFSEADKTKTRPNLSLNKSSIKSSTSTANSTSLSNDSFSFSNTNNNNNNYNKESFKSQNMDSKKSIKKIDLNQMNEVIESTLALSTETEINKLEPIEDVIDLDDDDEADYQDNEEEDEEENDYQFIRFNQVEENDYENKIVEKKLNDKKVNDELNETICSNNYENESNFKDIKPKSRGRKMALQRLFKFKF